MKLKDQSKELESMINAAMGNSIGSVPSITDDIPEELEPEPIFTINYSKEMSRSIKKARNSIKILIKSVIPKDFLNDPYVKDKLEQDAEALGKLYYQQHLIEKVEQANIDAIGQGNLSPRMFEVFNQTAKSHSDIAAQISQMQTMLRKSYIDMILDVQRKIEQEQNMHKQLAAPAEMKQIETEDDKFSRVFLGSKDLISKLNNSKKSKACQDFVEVIE